MKTRVKIALLLTLSFLLIGCSNSTTSSTPKNVLYENTEVGIVIYESTGWELEYAAKTGIVNASFANDGIKANVTLLPGNRKIEEIKSEVYLEGFMTIVEESDNYISFRTIKEGIRTDIYTEQKSNTTVLVAFVARDETYQTSEKMIQDFKSSIVLNN